ncbi:ankyrin [Gloeophyllum trabeum ATCC 11539]|uniref:Ankyrin n=1 Tax=Gloeophyllum trabeum (strain ATCC 11539 / FP-39264 / Madison 617) TaxID=670483 RepID=S7RQT0_GLOTA|nr:ankyrin [Gloeophyllum trabeum ATCC 11539]EPQ55269.1 ankyrin [Gloeophyllum trabeum ATCC 11539]
MSVAQITDEEKEDLLLSCRYGDLDDVKEFVNKYGQAPLAEVRDENGNTVLHMASGNGHIELLEYLLPLVPPSLLSAQNESKSTALHWACVNAHLPVVQKLVQFPGGPGVDLIDIKNAAGRSPLAEAEMAGWDEGAKWLVQVMNLEESGAKEVDEEVAAGASTQDVEVEIQDADGQIARMSLGRSDQAPSPDKPASSQP